MHMKDKNSNDNNLLSIQINAMSALLDNIGACAFVKDLAGKYIYVNADVAELFQIPHSRYCW